MSKPEHRRKFLQNVAAGTAFFSTPGLFAEQLARTATQAEGPFYPDKLPLDTDNDLIRITDNATPALGQITHLTGKILDAKGNPVRNALVEIWQCDNNGIYMHSRDPNIEKHDSNFQSYGRFLTSPTGEPLAARVGMATGLVVVGDLIGHGTAQEQTVAGETPNLAARSERGARALILSNASNFRSVSSMT